MITARLTVRLCLLDPIPRSFWCARLRHSRPTLLTSQLLDTQDTPCQRPLCWTSSKRASSGLERLEPALRQLGDHSDYVIKARPQPEMQKL